MATSESDQYMEDEYYDSGRDTYIKIDIPIRDTDRTDADKERAQITYNEQLLLHKREEARLRQEERDKERLEQDDAQRAEQLSHSLQPSSQTQQDAPFPWNEMTNLTHTEGKQTLKRKKGKDMYAKDTEAKAEERKRKAQQFADLKRAFMTEEEKKKIDEAKEEYRRTKIEQDIATSILDAVIEGAELEICQQGEDMNSEEEEQHYRQQQKQIVDKEDQNILDESDVAIEDDQYVQKHKDELIKGKPTEKEHVEEPKHESHTKFAPETKAQSQTDPTKATTAQAHEPPDSGETISQQEIEARIRQELQLDKDRKIRLQKQAQEKQEEKDRKNKEREERDKQFADDYERHRRAQEEHARHQQEEEEELQKRIHEEETKEKEKLEAEINEALRLQKKKEQEERNRRFAEECARRNKEEEMRRTKQKQEDDEARKTFQELINQRREEATQQEKEDRERKQEQHATLRRQAAMDHEQLLAEMEAEYSQTGDEQLKQWLDHMKTEPKQKQPQTETPRQATSTASETSIQDKERQLIKEIQHAKTDTEHLKAERARLQKDIEYQKQIHQLHLENEARKKKATDRTLVTDEQWIKSPVNGLTVKGQKKSSHDTDEDEEEATARTFQKEYRKQHGKDVDEDEVDALATFMAKTKITTSDRDRKTYIHDRVQQLQTANNASLFSGAMFQQHRGRKDSSSDTTSNITRISRKATPKKVETTTTNQPAPNIITRPIDQMLWKRMEMGTPQQNQVRQKEKEVQVQQNAFDQSAIMIKMMETLTNERDNNVEDAREIQQLVRLAQDTLVRQAKVLDQQMEEIKQSKKVATYYTPSVQAPPLYEYTDMNIPGTREALQAKNIRAAIDFFNKEKSPTQDFNDTWRQILLYTQHYRLDEAAYIQLLTIVIQGTASQVLYEMVLGKKSLHQILQTMGDLYSQRRTIVDEMTDLNNFKRKANESIHTAMQRCKIMAERVRHIWPDQVWDTTKRLEILLSVMKQIITDPTRKHLEYEEMKYYKTGTIMEYNAMLDLVDTFENTNDQIPNDSKGLSINVCTNAPKLAKKETESKTKDTEETSTPTDPHIRQLISNVSRITQALNINASEPMDTGSSNKKPVLNPPKFVPDIINKKRKLDESGTHENVPQEINREPMIPKRRLDDRRRFGNRPQGPPRIQTDATKSADKQTTKPPPQLVSPATGTPEHKAITYDKTGDQRQSRPQYRDYGANKDGEKKLYSGPAPYRSLSPYAGNNTYGNYRPRGYGYRRPYNSNFRYNRPSYNTSYNRYPQYNNGYRPSYYNRGYGGQSGRYPPREYRKEDENKEVKCPNCQKMHKIATFCPYTGETMKKDRQLALN